jgi:hypothetical protein
VRSEKYKRVKLHFPERHPNTIKRNFNSAWEVYKREVVGTDIDEEETDIIVNQSKYGISESTIKTAVNRYEAWTQKKLAIANVKRSNVIGAKSDASRKELQLLQREREHVEHMEKLSDIALRLQERLEPYLHHGLMQPIWKVAEANNDDCLLELLALPVANQLYEHMSGEITDFEKHKNWGDLMASGLTEDLLHSLRYHANLKEFLGSCDGCPMRN